MLLPSSEHIAQRDAIRRLLAAHIREGKMIRLPSFDPARPDDLGDFGGVIGPYRFQFEGEDDLLHLAIEPVQSTAFDPEEAMAIASFLLEGVPPALIWMKQGARSSHFYLGHDVLLELD